MKKTQVFLVAGLFLCLLSVLFFALKYGVLRDIDLVDGSIQESLEEDSIKKRESQSPSITTKVRDVSANTEKQTTQGSDRLYEEELKPTSSSNSLPVEQTLEQSMGKDAAKNAKESEQVLGSRKSIIPIYFTLLDREDYKPLTNYSLDLYSKSEKGVETNEKLLTDADGRIVFTASAREDIHFKFITADYAPLQGTYNVHYGENHYTLLLSKGGSIEVTVKTDDLKKVDSLIAFRDVFNSTDKFEMIFDEEKDVFSLSDLTAGLSGFCFEAKGYEKTEVYQTTIVSAETSKLEVYLTPVRTIILELSVGQAIDSIFVMPMKAETKLSSGKLRTEVPLHERNQYRYELPNKNIDRIAVYVSGYLPQIITLEPNKEKYFVLLEEGNQAKITVIDENNKPFHNATIKCVITRGLEDYNTTERIERAFFGHSVAYGDIVLMTNAEGVALLKGLFENESLLISVSASGYETLYRTWSFDSISSNTKEIKMSLMHQISGKVTFQSQPVMNVEVFIKRPEDDIILAHTISAEDGSYLFEELPMEHLAKPFAIKAFHEDYGVAEISQISLRNIVEKFDLELKKGKDIRLRFVDEEGKPVAFKGGIITSNFMNLTQVCRLALSIKKNQKILILFLTNNSIK